MIAKAVALSLLLAGGVRAQDRSASERGEPLLLGHRYGLSSKVLGQERPLFIGLPEHYDESLTRFPVLYVLDGSEERFLGVMAVARTLASQDRIPAAIVVAIPAGERNHELTPPTHDPAQAPAGSGGADAFLRFLGDELIPYVDSSFRTTRHRTLIGVSFGGLFSIHALCTRPDMFDALVAISPSVWWDRRAPVAALETFLRKPQVPARHLVVTIADEGAQTRGPIEEMTEMLRATAPPQFRWELLEIPAESHDTSAFPATWSALRSAFADWPITEDDVRAGLPGLERAYQGRAARYGVSADVPPRGYFEFGYRLLAEDEPELALAAFGRAAGLDPGYGYAFVGLSMAYERLARLDDAVASMRRAVELTKSRNQELAPLARRELARLEAANAQAR